MTPVTKERLAGPALILAVAAAAGLRMLPPFLLYGHSADIDAFRQLVFDAAIRSGDGFPRWVPQYYHGFGSPIFQFYAPLPYYLTEVWVLLGASIPAALKITLWWTWAASGLATYLFARDFLSRPAAAVAGVLYLLAPYHLVDMLVRHAFGEHVAFLWIPLAAWGLTGLFKEWSRARFAVAALAVAALPFTHNITALITVAVLAVWCLVLWIRSKNHRGAASAIGAALLGLVITAFFWLPAFVEKANVFADESLTEEFFRYTNHFVYAWQLFAPTWGYGGSRPGTADDHMSFQIGLVHWVLIAAVVAFAIGLRNRPERRLWIRSATAPALILVFAALVTTPLSKPIWDAVSLLAYVQFPWRFLTLAAFGSSVLAAFAVDTLADAESGNNRRRWGAALGATMAAVVVYGAYTTPHFAVFDANDGDPREGTADEMRQLLDTNPVFRSYRDALTLDHVMASGMNGTSRDDYLPRTVTQVPVAPAAAIAQVLEGGSITGTTRTGPNRYRFDVAMDSDGFLLFNQFAFAGWEASIDGATTETMIEKGYGAQVLSVPAGPHVVEFRFGSTPLRRTAATLSWIAAALWLGVVIGGLFAVRGPHRADSVTS